MTAWRLVGSNCENGMFFVLVLIPEDSFLLVVTSNDKINVIHILILGFYKYYILKPKECLTKKRNRTNKDYSVDSIYRGHNR